MSPSPATSERPPPGGGGGRGPLHSRSRRWPLVVPPQTTIRELLYSISQGTEDAAVISDPDSGLPLGLVTLRELLNSVIFFDFRPVYGRFEPVDKLRAWLAFEVRTHGRFLRSLAEQAVSVTPPLGWAGQFSYDRNRDFPHTLDLKHQGARLFTDNRVDPADLNELHRLMLKEALRQAKKLQLRVRQQFGI